MQPAPPLSFADALAALRWQVAMGADDALENEPVNLTVAATAAAPLEVSSTPAPVYKVRPAAPTAAPVMAPRPPAIDLAQILTLADLKTAMEKIEGLSIRETAMNMVFGEGAEQPPVMLIGEAPGEEEDRSGRPFIGRAGQLLDKMISSLGFTREQLYITNVLPWRPPGNRTPKPEEVATCLPYLQRHIELVRPKLLLLLGGPAAKALLGKDESVTRMRGLWTDYKTPGLPDSVPALVTYHPAYLLRTPLQKRESWRDLRLLKKKIGCVE